MGNNNSSVKFKQPQIDEEQLNKLRADFNNYDKNGNHFLEREELESFLTDNMPDLLQFSKMIMDLFGTGKKDTISFDMFQIFYKSLQYIGNNEQDPSSLPMLIFSKLDKDDNYYISYKEIKYLLNLLRPDDSKEKVTKKEAKKIIHNMKPAREEWGLSRDEFIELFDSYITTQADESESISHLNPNIVAFGLNNQCQIGENSKSSHPSKLDLVGGPEWRCIAAGDSHTVFITSNNVVYGLGSNEQFQLGGPQKICSSPTPLLISEKTIIWAACGESFTVFLSDDGKLIFCGSACMSINQANPKPYVINARSKKKFVYVSACSKKFCAIDSKGKIFIYEADPRQRPLINKLSAPAYDVACGYSSISRKFCAIAVSITGEAYGFEGLNNNLHHFSPIEQLSGIQVRKVYGHSNHLAVLTDKGQIMTYGNGTHGQCGNGTNEGNASFKLINCKENVEFVDVGLGDNHSIFITKDGNAFSCGNNEHCQLGLGKTNKPILDPTRSDLFDGKVVGAICGSNHTLVLINSKRIQHPGMESFGIKQI